MAGCGQRRVIARACGPTAHPSPYGRGRLNAAATRLYGLGAGRAAPDSDDTSATLRGRSASLTGTPRKARQPAGAGCIPPRYAGWNLPSRVAPRCRHGQPPRQPPCGSAVTRTARPSTLPAGCRASLGVPGRCPPDPTARWGSLTTSVRPEPQPARQAHAVRPSCGLPVPTSLGACPDPAPPGPSLALRGLRAVRPAPRLRRPP